MAKNPDTQKPGKSAKSRSSGKASRPDVQPIGPALAELLNPAINRGESGIGSSTGLQPPPDNSWDRRSGGEAAAHRARASTRDTQEDVAKRDATRDGLEEAPQANYGTAATIPTLDPELARQLGLPTAEDDEAELARPPRNKMEALGVQATAEALENLIREGRPEFRGEDGQLKVWTPHRPPRPEKSEGGVRFEIKSEYQPKGDQPTAIAELVEGIERNDRMQVLLGVTGSGKTYTMAKVIEATQRPALILAPNKTLAAQLYGEFKNFFPDNAVEYFVSYYDYYQPEAYVPRTDTYIEKDSSINEQIDRMRHSATRALLERDDVIIVASVSCIYGIGSVETYTAMTFALKKGERIDQRQLIADLVALQYKRTQADFTRGTFRVRGDVVDIFPAHYEDRAWRVNLFGDTVENIEEFDPLTGHKQDELEFIKIYANSHYVTPRPTLVQAIKSIKSELKLRLDELHNQGRLLEAQRLEQRTTFDLEMMEATGSCAGIENYSRYLTGRRPGEPPPTLFEYVPDNALVFADESHVTIPQIGGMFRGDFRRKATLGRIRLPPALLHGQPPAALRGMGHDAPAIRGGVGHTERLGAERERRRVRRAGDPPDRADRSAGQHPPRPHPGRRSRRRGARHRAGRLSLADHGADQTHGGGPHRISARAGHSRALHAQRYRHHRAHRDHPRSSSGCVRRAGRHQSAARGPRHSRMRAGSDPRCRQGRFSAQRDLADPDHRPRRAQCRRQGGALCRQRHRLDGARHRRDRSPPRETGRIQQGPWHHAGEHQALDPRHHEQRLRARPCAGRDRRRRHGR